MNKISNWSHDDQSTWCIECGKMQSPINIDTSRLLKDDFGKISIHMKQMYFGFKDHSYTGQANLKGYSMIAGRRFDALQIHFHTPSEHTIDHKHYAMEGHVVHLGIDGRLAVIGIFFEEGENNLAFQVFLDQFKSGSYEGHIAVDLDTIFPSLKSYYHYIGSLTTPPTNENVEWYILKDDITISKKQLEEYKLMFGDRTNRDVQKLNDRPVIYSDYYA